MAGMVASANAGQAATTAPAAPDLFPASSAAGTALFWTSGPATGFAVEQATNQAMSANLRHYRITDDADAFTPYGLRQDKAYYFRVRAIDGTATSAYSNVVVAAALTKMQPARILTYNILELTNDGKHEGDGVIAPWSKRQPKAAALIKSANPDFVGIQEGSSWVGAPRGPRQVDALTSALGGAYALAKTEIPPNQRGFFRTGVYILYKTSTYEAIENGGHWSIGNGHYAAYQLLENRVTGSQILVVSTHLLVGLGAADDRKREAETVSLFHHGQVASKADQAPVIYVGDFNSTEDANHVFDGPGIAAHNDDIEDGFSVAQTLTNGSYNSANEYLRRPPASADRIDHIFAPPGIAVPSAGIVLNLKNGKFVGVIPSDHNPVVANIRYPY
jgi:endonuclease/exonuclease/phosphatase family metal-dependent hydrolase